MHKSLVAVFSLVVTLGVARGGDFEARAALALAAARVPQMPVSKVVQTSDKKLPCEKTTCDCGCEEGKRCWCAEPQQESELHRQWRAAGFAPDATGVWTKTVIGAAPVVEGSVSVPVTVPRPVYYRQTQAYFGGRACSS